MRPLLAAALLRATAASAEPLPDAPRADEPTFAASPEVDLLYSSQFTFTRAGLPLHRIRVREGVTDVRIEGDGLALRAGGAEGAEVRAGAAFAVRVVSSRPARVRYWIAAERRRADDPRGAAEALSRLRAAAPGARIFEVGTLFAVEGRTVDGRRLVVALGPYETPEAARAAARSASLPADLHVELVERAQGTLEAVSDTGAIVRARDLLWFKPGCRTPDGTCFSPLRLGAGPSGAEGGASTTYPGDLYVAIDRNGRLAVVNAVDEEQLLSGLLPAEMPASSPMAALEAQAVAARTELLVKMGERHLADPYRLCGESHCQVYRGADRQHPRATEAVRATRGEVLLDGDGRLVDALWSACCGGHTEDNDRLWASAPVAALRGLPDGAPEPPGASDAALRRYLASAPAAFCARASSHFRWTQRLDARDAGDRLGIGALRDLVVLARGVSGRVTALRAIGATGESEIHGELAIRQALGGVKSSLFVVERDEAGAGLLLRGGGYGHGVGLCQAGAIGRARAGHGYRRILEHYYRGATLVRLY
ncbi:MAG: SpoIID/LytB domain-containing protein [Myxococcota bacterium]